MDTSFQTIDATFDGNVFRPDVPVEIPANTRVRLTVQANESHSGQAAVSFFDVAKSLQIEGPADWASNLEEYMYGRKDQPE